MDREAIYQRLQEFLTPRRQELIEEKLKHRTNFLTIAIDDVKKEHNSGALIRTAESFGIQKVSIVDPEFLKKSARNISIGAQKWIDLQVFEEWKSCLLDLRKEGYDIVSTTADTSGISLQEFQPQKPCAILFGNEIEGLPEEVIESSDHKLHIPTNGFSESLNVSVSAGIILFDLKEKMKKTLDISSVELTDEEKWKRRILWAVRSIPNGEAILKSVTENQS